MADSKFPSEVIDLPSEGKLYPKEHPCSNGKIEIKYMTAKEEDILTSQNLIKKGVVIDRLMDSLILTPGVKSDDLILGDKNAVMVAARILAYGPEYVCDVVNPNTSETINHTFNLADCPFKKLPEEITENKFEVDLPISKKKVTFKLLTGKEETIINEELKASKKLGSDVSPELTTRLRHTIISVDGDDSQSTINNFVQNLLARDSMYLRKEIRRVTPDIELSQEIEIGGETVKVDIPMTVGFFWPES
jgi:hypothetical protein